jgi:hypothetical protein
LKASIILGEFQRMQTRARMPPKICIFRNLLIVQGYFALFHIFIWLGIFLKF